MRKRIVKIDAKEEKKGLLRPRGQTRESKSMSRINAERRFFDGSGSRQVESRNVTVQKSFLAVRATADRERI